MADRAPIRIPTHGRGLDNDSRIISSSFEKDTKERFAKNETLIYAVLAVVAITLIGVVISSLALYLDQSRFNNQTYKEQSRAEIDVLNAKIEATDKKLDALAK